LHRKCPLMTQSGHQPALTPALPEHQRGLLPSGVLRLGLLGHTDATTRRPLGRVIHYEELRSRRGPCDTSPALKTGPSGNCRRFSIRRRVLPSLSIEMPKATGCRCYRQFSRAGAIRSKMKNRRPRKAWLAASQLSAGSRIRLTRKYSPTAPLDADFCRRGTG
jgi:hypothetical protein